MSAAITATDLSRYLKSIHNQARGVDRLKIAYRPYICPFEDLLTLVRAGERVFDIGCGSGQFALLLARFVKPSWIGGADISENLIRNAKELFGNSKTAIEHDFRVFDGKNFPESIRTADRVFLIDVFHHVPRGQQEDFLVSLWKCMQPGSVLVLKDIDAASPLVFFNKLHDRIISNEVGHEISVRQLISMAQKAGFRLVSESKRRMFWYPHFTLLLDRGQNLSGSSSGSTAKATQGPP